MLLLELKKVAFYVVIYGLKKNGKHIVMLQLYKAQGGGEGAMYYIVFIIKSKKGEITRAEEKRPV